MWGDIAYKNQQEKVPITFIFWLHIYIIHIDSETYIYVYILSIYVLPLDCVFTFKKKESCWGIYYVYIHIYILYLVVQKSVWGTLQKTIICNAKTLKNEIYTYIFIYKYICLYMYIYKGTFGIPMKRIWFVFLFFSSSVFSLLFYICKFMHI